jgi:hypothetical protein
MTDKISPAWRKQFHKEERYDRDFKYAEGKKSLKGGLANPKNWPGGKWEMTHDPYENRKNLNRKKVTEKSKSAVTGKKSSNKKTTRKRVAGK